MSRVQFVETVTAPGGVNGALIPLVGVGSTPYVVDVNGVEGGQANAYAGRTGATAASSLVTDASGTVSYWLDAGDYNIHFQDQQAPPRIPNYIRGFTAPVINTDQIVVGAQNLIQFTGDLKFSLYPADHGLKSDGSYEWLLMTSDPDGGGRQIDGTIYAALRAVLGNPALTAGKFRIPNVSGRALIASGIAAGLTARNPLALVGAELHQHATAHLQVDIGAGVGVDIGAVAGSAGAQGIPRLDVINHSHGLSANGFAEIGIGSVGGPTRSAIVVGQLAGSFGAFDRWWDNNAWGFDTPGGIGPYNGIALAGNTDGYTAGSATQTYAYNEDGNAYTIGGAASIPAHTGTVRAHNGVIDQGANSGLVDTGFTMQPSIVVNVFVKT